MQGYTVLGPRRIFGIFRQTSGEREGNAHRHVGLEMLGVAIGASNIRVYKSPISGNFNTSLWQIPGCELGRLSGLLVGRLCF